MNSVIIKILIDNKKIQDILNSIFNRKNKLLLFIKGCEKLPNDVTRKIYEEYLKPDILFEDLINILQILSSRKLYAVPLTIFMPILLQNKILLEYLLKKDDVFKEIYSIHIIKETNMYFHPTYDINSSMAMSWLTHLYH